MSASVATDVGSREQPRAIPPDIWAFFAARTLSQLGNYLQFVALPLWVLAVTGSPVATGLAFAVEVLPAVFLAPWAGYVVDRFDRRNLLMACETLSAVAVGGLLVAVSYQVVPLVYVAALVIRVFDAFSMPTVVAILSSRLSESARPRAIATLEALAGGVITIGPIVGTLVYGEFGIRILLVANLVSFVAASVILAFLPACPGSGSLGGVRAALTDAIRLVVRDRLLLPVALAEIGYFLCFGGVTALATLIAERSVGPQLTGLYLTGLGFGWLLGSTFVVRRFADHARALVLAGVLGCAAVGLVLWKVLALGPVACFAAGVLAGVVNVLVVSATTILYSVRLPPAAIGRVFAGRRAWMNLALALSYPTLTSVATVLGPGTTAMIAGGITAVVAGALLAPVFAAGPTWPGTAEPAGEA